MTIWHHLPPNTLPTLAAIGALCPRGWVELVVEHIPAGDSWGGSTPTDADSNCCPARLWGVDSEDAERLDEALLGFLNDDDGYELLGKLPHEATFLMRIVHGPPVCNGCGKSVPLDSVCGREECTDFGYPVPQLRLESFGEGGPVYTTGEVAVYGAAQPAPVVGVGDMWARLIERYERHVRPELLALFHARRELGLERYGVPLQAHNGRDVCTEIVDETLDRLAYFEQAAVERPHLAPALDEIQRRDLITLTGLLVAFGRLSAE